ncbi:MAG: hypothetical protein HYZ44_00060 [Bacteroidetes bacterium]|nr:hypothetical protein [Bacteroidota bacterium]
MIEKIIKSLREELESKLVILGVSPSKTRSAVDLAQRVVSDTLSVKASLPELANLFLSGKPFEESPLMAAMIGEYKMKMVSKLNMSEATAQSASTFMIQFIMAQLGNAVSRQDGALDSLRKGSGPFGRLKDIGGSLLKTLVF